MQKQTDSAWQQAEASKETAQLASFKRALSGNLSN